MSNRNPRNLQLLEQIKNNPLKKALVPGFDISEFFAKDMEAVGLDRRLSAEGRKEKAQDYLRKALRDRRDHIQKPIDKYHDETEAMRATAKLPTYDKTDVVGFLRRQELRVASRAMTFG